MQMSIDKLICQKEPSSRLGVFFLLSSASSYNTNLFSFLSEKVEFHALSFALNPNLFFTITHCMYVRLPFEKHTINENVCSFIHFQFDFVIIFKQF